MEAVGFSEYLFEGLPWWLSDKESASAKADLCDPYFRKIPHSTEQLSLCTTSIAPVPLAPGDATSEPMHCSY